MFDDLLGRTALKEEIAELETERTRLRDQVEELESQLEATERRRREAATARQTAQERANRLEDRVEQLEDTVERLESDDSTIAFRQQDTLRGGHLSSLLDRLQSVATGREGAFTAFVPDGHDVPDAVRDAFGERTALVSRAAPCLAVRDDLGLIAACLRPPIEPEPFTRWSDQFHIEREWFEPYGTYTFALVRSDLFGMATYDGTERTAFHGFDSALKSQHSKGGFSQGRFERLREEQIDDHVDRCLAALEERETDRLIVTGERTVLGEFMHLADATKTVDATGQPESALDDAWRAFWTAQVRML